jgi:hypothetical protein
MTTSPLTAREVLARATKKPEIRRAVVAVRAALDRPKRRDADLVGRWRIADGGRAFTVRTVNAETRLALVSGGDNRRYAVKADDLHALADHGALVYAGRA